MIKIPGIGRKTAERLLLELRDRLAAGWRRGRRPRRRIAASRRAQRAAGAGLQREGSFGGARQAARRRLAVGGSHPAGAASAVQGAMIRRVPATQRAVCRAPERCASPGRAERCSSHRHAVGGACVRPTPAKRSPGDADRQLPVVEQVHCKPCICAHAVVTAALVLGCCAAGPAAASKTDKNLQLVNLHRSEVHSRDRRLLPQTAGAACGARSSDTCRCRAEPGQRLERSQRLLEAGRGCVGGRACDGRRGGSSPTWNGCPRSGRGSTTAT